MHAVGGLALLRAKRLARVADVAGAMTLEALRGTPVAFDERIHNARPHPGAKGGRAPSCSRFCRTARFANRICTTIRACRTPTACAACRRCTARFAARSRIARRSSAIESGSATDNPLVFSDNGDVLSGGNFHGAPLALALDYAAIAMTDLMSISERRIDRLTNPDLSEGLARFPRATSRDAIRLHDCARRRRRAAERSQGPGASRERRQSADLRRKGRSRLDGNDRRAEVAHDCGKRGERCSRSSCWRRRKAWNFGGRCKAGNGVERAFAIVAHARRRGSTRTASLSRDIERVAEAIRGGEFDSDDGTFMSDKRTIRAPRGNGAAAAKAGTGSRAAHADEQPRSRSRGSAGPADRLRRNRTRGAELGSVRRDRAARCASWRTTRRCWCNRANRSAFSARTTRRRAS